MVLVMSGQIARMSIIGEMRVSGEEKPLLFVNQNWMLSTDGSFGINHGSLVETGPPSKNGLPVSSRTPHTNTVRSGVA